MRKPDPEEIDALSAKLFDAVKPLLAGKDAQVQGAALADLIAIWLAGHASEGPEATRAVREELLALHILTVRQLIYINSSAMGTVVTHEEFAT